MTYRIASFSAASLIAALTFSSCSSDTSPVAASDSTAQKSALLTRLADSVIVPTYNNLEAKAMAVSVQAQKVVLNTATQADLDQLAALWKEARLPWEQSEGFLFGPVDYESLDPSLDTWPVDESQLKGILNGSQELNLTTVKALPDDGLKGFHTIEYLIFKDGKVRALAEISAREKEYLSAASQVFAQDAKNLALAWTKADGFKGEFVQAGVSGKSRYQTQNDAVIDVVQKCVDILDEVGNGKIADPFKSGDKNQVESQFAYHSLVDFANNIRSVRNIWTGTLAQNNSVQGLGEWANTQKSGLGESILKDIDAVIASIEAIPAPFSEHLNATTEINMALDKLSALQIRFESEVKVLVK